MYYKKSFTNRRIFFIQYLKQAKGKSKHRIVTKAYKIPKPTTTKKVVKYNKVISKLILYLPIKFPLLKIPKYFKSEN